MGFLTMVVDFPKKASSSIQGPRKKSTLSQSSLQKLNPEEGIHTSVTGSWSLSQSIKCLAQLADQLGRLSVCFSKIVEFKNWRRFLVRDGTYKTSANFIVPVGTSKITSPLAVTGPHRKHLRPL
ncbi:hypothetical protein R1flu_018347 [Riccia fluitans]|uniref:LAGLIDADG homing endonuclease n=1 Tax=Riccia fluitans TaxID=41844 RepID=A0ABD1ZFK8_9MARC